MIPNPTAWTTCSNTNGVEFVGEAAFSNVWKTVTNRTDIGNREFCG